MSMRSAQFSLATDTYYTGSFLDEIFQNVPLVACFMCAKFDTVDKRDPPHRWNIAEAIAGRGMCRKEIADRAVRALDNCQDFALAPRHISIRPVHEHFQNRARIEQLHALDQQRRELNGALQREKEKATALRRRIKALTPPKPAPKKRAPKPAPVAPPALAAAPAPRAAPAPVEQMGPPRPTLQVPPIQSLFQISLKALLRFGLPATAYQLLKEHKVAALEQLERCTDDQLLALIGMTPELLASIRAAIADYRSF